MVMDKETVLEKDGGQRVTVKTDERGTVVLDEDDQVIASYGSDRHAEIVQNYIDGGWVVVR